MKSTASIGFMVAPNTTKPKQIKHRVNIMKIFTTCLFAAVLGVAVHAKPTLTLCEETTGRSAFPTDLVAEVGFNLVLRQAPNGVSVSLSATNAVCCDVSRAGDRRILRYSFGDGSPLCLAEVIETTNGKGERRYRFVAEIRPGWFLEERSFPEIVVPAEVGGRKRAFISGEANGGYNFGRGSFADVNSASAGAFAATWDDESGTYFGVEDPQSLCRRCGFMEDGRGLYFTEIVNGWKTGRDETDYDIVVRDVRRTGEKLVWTDFLDIYRAWDDRQPWSRLKLADRTDLPGWLKSGAAMTRFSRQWLEDPERLERHLKWWRRSIGDQPVIAAIWGWEKVGIWWGPDYFPCHPDDDTFRACMAVLKKYGFHPFAWPSGYSWAETIGGTGDGRHRIDYRDSFVKAAFPHLSLDRDGTWSHDAFWYDNGSFVTLCGGDAWSRDWLAGKIVRGLADRGVEIIQIDQVGGAKMHPCWNPAHGHELGRGDWIVRDLRKLLTDVRSVPGISFVCNEHRCERLNDLIGLQDYRDLTQDADVLAGVFNYLHHDKVPVFQSNPQRCDPWFLAYMAAEGQMPFLEPLREQSVPSRPALLNGGFEETTDNSRGPVGWDRRTKFGGYLKGVDVDEPNWGVSGWCHSGWLGFAVNNETNVVHDGAVALRVNHDSRDWPDYGRHVQLAQSVCGLKPGRYAVSCWVAEANGLGEMMLGTSAGGRASVRLPVAKEWTRVSAEVEISGEDLVVIFHLPLGTRFVLDDVRLERDGREVMKETEAEDTAFCRKWIDLYCREASKWLLHGRRIRAPELVCDKIRIGGAGREVNAVCPAAYRAADGTEAVVFANGTKVRRHFRYRWKGTWRDGVLAPMDILVVQSALSGELEQ